ncbi:MAG: TldD/PmbA family protein [Actinomycetota bacterium]|nr:TldD/PmbA family protein [Actinomycetota bacterium]
MSDLPGLCDAVLALVGGRAEAEVTASAGRSALTRFANSNIHQNVAEDHHGVRLRLATDGRLAAASTDRIDPEGLERLVENTFAAARLRPRDERWPGLAPPGGGDAVAHHDPGAHYDPATHRAPAAERAEVVRAFVDAGPGLSAAGYCSSGGYEVFFANSAGRRVGGRTSHATVDGIHRGPGTPRRSGTPLGGPVGPGTPEGPTADGSGWQSSMRLSALDGAWAGATAAAKARAGVGPIDLAPGRYQVVLEPSCVADLLDFLVGYGFSAKAHAEGRSAVRLGEAQFDPAVNLADDAADDRAVSLTFDAEGTPRQRLQLVRDGVPTNLLHDRRTAPPAGTESTGHATPGGESYGPAPSTVVMAAGTHSAEKLIAGVDRGLLVTEFWYTRILDPKSQVVTGLTRNGVFLIERGEVAGAVANLRFTQSYADALAPGNVVAVGSDARLRGTDAIVPSLHLASWNFTGGARG